MTLEKMRLSMLAVAETGSTKAVDVLGRVMNETLALAQKYGPAGAEYNDDLYSKYLKLTVETARALAPYQTPQLATVRVGGDRENPPLVPEGVTSKQVWAELAAKIKATGLLPTNLKNMIDVTPQRMESQSG
jgi:hypothetical protein